MWFGLCNKGKYGGKEGRRGQETGVRREAYGRELRLGMWMGCRSSVWREYKEGKYIIEEAYRRSVLRYFME